jgi:hypothetical protein
LPAAARNFPSVAFGRAAQSIVQSR